MDEYRRVRYMHEGQGWTMPVTLEGADAADPPDYVNLAGTVLIRADLVTDAQS